jgi:hypothetical protein
MKIKESPFPGKSDHIIVGCKSEGGNYVDRVDIAFGLRYKEKSQDPFDRKERCDP